jgi:tight adherence protein C
MLISLLDLLIQLLVFTGAVALTLLLGNYVRGELSVRRRLTERSSVAAATQSSPLFRSTSVDNPVLQWVRDATRPEAGKEGSELRRNLAAAGFSDPAAPVWYVIIRFGLAIGLPVLFLAAQGLLSKPLAGAPLILLTLLLCGAGLIGPRSVVDRRARERREQMENEFPDVLDLIMICVGAGLGVDAAFARVGDEVRESHPLIAQQFERLALEINAGRARSEALENMAERAGVETLKAFVALVVQSDSLGVSISQTLKSFSEEMREGRVLRAEEKAMRIPVLMTAPITACFLPVTIFSILLPPIIDMVRSLGPALMGHH